MMCESRSRRLTCRNTFVLYLIGRAEIGYGKRVLSYIIGHEAERGTSRYPKICWCPVAHITLDICCDRWLSGAVK